MSDLRSWVAAWRRKNGGTCEFPAAHALKALEEVVELCYAAGARTGEIYDVVGRKAHKAEDRGENNGCFNLAAVKEECAGSLICLEVIGVACGFSLDSEAQQKIQVLESRSWAPDARGVLRRPR